MKHAFIYTMIFSIHWCVLFGMHHNAMQEVAIDSNYILELYDEMLIKIVSIIPRSEWPFIMYSCKKFNRLLHNHGVTIINNGQNNLSINQLLHDECRRINRTYQYVLLIQHQKELDTLHTYDDLGYINPMVNWLPELYDVVGLNTSLTPLFWACVHGNLKEFTFLLSKVKKEKLNTPVVVMQLRALFTSYKYNENLSSQLICFMKVLNRVGFNFNQEIPEAGFPLMLLIKEGNSLLIEFLLRKCKVNVNMLLPSESFTSQTIHFRCKTHKEPKVVQHSQRRPTFISSFTPICYVVKCSQSTTYKNYINIARILINHGANPKYFDGFGGYISSMSNEHQFGPLVRIILKSGTNAYTELHQKYFPDSIKQQFIEVFNNAQLVSRNKCELQ